MLKLNLDNKDEFVSIEKSPYAQKGHSNLVKLWAKCPVCQKDVNNEKGQIVLLGKWEEDGEHKRHDIFTLTDKFDDYRIEFPENFDAKKDMTVEFICPSCKSSLLLESKHDCKCGSPCFMLAAFSKSIITLCSRTGCKEHMLYLHKDDTWPFIRQIYTDSAQ